MYILEGYSILLLEHNQPQYRIQLMSKRLITWITIFSYFKYAALAIAAKIENFTMLQRLKSLNFDDSTIFRSDLQHNQQPTLEILVKFYNLTMASFLDQFRAGNDYTLYLA
jgi:hypothetical protein